jgi:hypothetical protein
MFWLEQELRKTGDPSDLARAVIISSMLEERGEDIPLPGTAVDEQLARETGVLALGSVDAELLGKTNEQITRESSSLALLQVALEQIGDPYVTLAQRHTPSYKEPESKLFRRTQQSEKAEVNYSIPKTAQKPYSARVDILYKKASNENIPQSVRALLFTKNGQASVVCRIRDGRVAGLTMEGPVAAQLSASHGKNIGRFLSAQYSQKDPLNTSVHDALLSFDLTNHTMRIEFDYWRPQSRTAGQEHSARLEYLFDAASNVFTASFNEGLKKWDTDFSDEELSVSHYCELLASALKLIPAVEVLR